MKKIKRSILAALLCACMLVGIISPLSTATVSAAETVTGTEPEFSNTKYMISNSKEHMLIATGIKNYDDVYEVGYAFKGMDGITKLHAVTTKYYTSITSGNNTWNVSSLFGSEYTGMIVWEVAYDTAKDYAYEVYAKVGNRVDGQLVATDNVVYGTRKDVVNNYAATFVVGNDFVEERAITVGEPYGKLPEAPASDVGTFKGWYLNADGEGEAITADTLVTTKGNHTLYAIYDNKISYDFSDQSQLDNFSNAENVTYEIESYLKVTGTPGSECILVLKKELTAGQTVEIDVEYVTSNATYSSENQITFLAYTANMAGDADGIKNVVKGNASWDGGWDCKQTTVAVDVTQDCAGIRMQFVMNNDAGAYFKITGIRIVSPVEIEYPIVYDFSDESQLDDFGNAQNTSYEIVDDYMKVVGTHGSESTFVLKKELTAGQTVEIDVEYVTSNATYSGENQITFLAYTANEAGNSDGVTTAVMGNASWDGGWDCTQTTVPVKVTQDCSGIRMQFVMNSDEGAYFKITSIRIVEYPIAYDFSDESQLEDFGNATNINYELDKNYNSLKVVGTPGAENILVLKSALKAGMKVDIDIEYVTSDATFVNGVNQFTFLAYTANATGGADNVTTVVKGNASWDGGWNAENTTVSVGITQDCAGIRMQFVMNNDTNAYFKITSIRILDGSTLPTYTVTTNNNGNEASFDLTFGEKYGTNLPDTTPEQAHVEFKGWYLNPTGTGAPITADTAMTIKGDHTIYAVYGEGEEHPRTSDFFEDGQLTNIANLDNTDISHVRDASGNYIKLSPTTSGDTTNANYPQSEFFFSYPYLQEGWVVEMDFELVCDAVNSGQGIYTYEAAQDGSSLSAEKCLMTLWDAGETAWNGGKFTAVTRITQACQGVRVLVRYANNPDAYWKLTSIRVYTSNEYLDIPIYADDKQIDIGATSWLGTDQTINYFNGDIGEANFKKLQEAGITTLAGTFYGDTGSEDDEKRLLDLAAEYGIGLYFQKTWDGETIPSYVSHEAFLGYYIDEPSLAELDDMGTLQQKWDNSAFGTSGKLLYVNLLPIYSDEAGDSYETYLSTAIDKGLQMVSYDHYAMYYKAKTIFSTIYGYESNLSCRTDWLHNFDIASSYANTKNIPLWYTLLTTQHLADGDLTMYKDPNVNDLTYQMYVAMTYGATHLTHYTFAGTGDYIIDGAMFNQDTGEWTQTYTDVKDASTIIGQWDHVFMNFDWLGVSAVEGTSAQTGFINNLTNSVAINANNVMQSVTSTQDVLVGHFEDANGYDGVMVTNLTIPENATSTDVTITFSNEYQAVKVYQNGQETLVYLNDGVLSLDVASAEGVFLIPVKAK